MFSSGKTAEGGSAGGKAFFGKLKRPTPLWATIVAGVVGLTLGSALSGGGAAETRKEVASLEQQLVEAERTATSLRNAQDQHESEKSRLGRQMTDAQDRARAAEERATVAEARIVELESAEPVAVAEDPAPAQSAPVPLAAAPPAAPAPPANVHYRNCSEARAAGAAPIHRGQPGYGSHLDRDGDGIACE